MTMYLERMSSSPAGAIGTTNITDIKTAVNKGVGRPDTTHTNSHLNFKWWLEQRFPKLKFDLIWVNEEIAGPKIVGYIDRGSPVLMAVSHARVEGHIMLTIGYENYVPGVSSEDFQLVVHDPYGAFHPTLHRKDYGANRWAGGSSLASGGEIGPGQSCHLPLTAMSRQRTGDKAFGTFTLLAARL
jgi:hypothetical protein